jgi:hypothetical protein
MRRCDSSEYVLILAAEIVALGDDVGGVDHRHVDVGRILQDFWVARGQSDADSPDHPGDSDSKRIDLR